MKAMPAAARPTKMCQLRSLKRLLDHPKASVERVATKYRIAEISETLQICQFCSPKSVCQNCINAS